MLPRAAAVRRRKVFRRPDDVAGAGRRAASPVCAGWRFSAFRCIRPESHPPIAQNISPISGIPMLFLQGTRDALAELRLLEPVVESLSPLASLHLVREADHSFHVLARSGRNDREVLDEVLDAVTT